MSKFRDMSAIFGGNDTPLVPTAQSLPTGTEQVVTLDPTEILPYPRHTYRSISDQEMRKLEESIRENGVIQPAVVRFSPQGRHEMIAGHQRQQACINLGRQLPCIIRQLDDDAADIAMVDGNKQRDISLFERARSQRLKYEAMCRQGERRDLTGAEDAGKWSLEKLAEDDGKSASTVYRIVRLGYLNDELLDMTQEKRIEQMGGVALSHLGAQSQSHVADYLLTHDKERLSKQQASTLRESDRNAPLTPEKVAALLEKPVKQEKKKSRAISIPAKRIDKVLAEKGLSFGSKKDIIEFIIAAVQAYEQEHEEDTNGQTDFGFTAAPA